MNDGQKNSVNAQKALLNALVLASHGVGYERTDNLYYDTEYY